MGITAMDKLRRAKKTLSFKKSNKSTRDSPEHLKSSDSGHGSVHNDYEIRHGRPKEKDSKREKRSKHKSKDKSRDGQNNLPSVLLPRAFYDTEKKLIALEQAYSTLKKVLTKHFSTQSKSSIRRSFHEAKTKLERGLSLRSLDAVSLTDRYGSNRSLDSIGSNKSNKASETYKATQRLLKEAEKLEHEGLSSLVFTEMANSINFCKNTEAKTAENVTNKLVRKIDMEIQAFRELKYNWINPLRDSVNEINGKTTWNNPQQCWRNQEKFVEQLTSTERRMNEMLDYHKQADSELILCFLDYQIHYHRESYQKLREFKAKITDGNKYDDYAVPERTYDIDRRRRKSNHEKVYEEKKKMSIRKQSFTKKKNSRREDIYEPKNSNSDNTIRDHINSKSSSGHYKIEHKKSNDSGLDHVIYQKPPSNPTGKFCRAIFSYDRGQENELSFQAHEMLEILSYNNKDLSYFGRTVNDSRFGKFPMNVVEIIQNYRPM